MGYENYYAKQTFIGGNGGNWFSYGFYPPLDGRTVKKIGVWAGGWQIKAIQIWRSGSSGSDSRTFGSPGGSYREIEFQPGEQITKMSLWGNGAGTRLGWIYFETNKKQVFDFGMTDWGKKQEYPVDVGSGICVGVYGNAGEDIDAGCFVFLRPVRSATLKNVQYPNLTFDTLGITPKTLDSYTDRNTGSQDRNWTFGGGREMVTSESWSVTVGLEVHQEISVEAGIPEVATVGGKFGWKISVSGSHNITNQDTRQLTWSQSGTLKPGESVSLQALTRVGTLPSLDYKGEMEIRLQNGEIFAYAVEGSYKGVDCTAVEVTDIPSGTVLSQGELRTLPSSDGRVTVKGQVEEVRDPHNIPLQEVENPLQEVENTTETRPGFQVTS